MNILLTGYQPSKGSYFNALKPRTAAVVMLLTCSIRYVQTVFERPLLIVVLLCFVTAYYQ